MYNILFDEIGLNSGIIASFYYYRMNSRKTILDRITPKLERKGKRVVILVLQVIAVALTMII